LTDLFWKPEHPRAKIELTQEVYIKEKPMLYTPEDIKEFSVQIKELLEKGLIRPSKGSYSLKCVNPPQRAGMC